MNANEFESALIQLGLSKAELARRLGVHPTTVYRWDRPEQYAVAYLEERKRGDQLERKVNVLIAEKESLMRRFQVADEMDAMQRRE